MPIAWLNKLANNAADTLAVAVAVVLAAAFMAGCGARVVPQGPGEEPEATAVAASEDRRDQQIRRPAVQEMVIGEMCPAAVGGRPAVKPLFVRGLMWSTDRAEVRAPIARRMARQFSVLSWDGRRAGLYSIAGLSDVGLDSEVVIGAYSGGSPCAGRSQVEEASAGDTGGQTGANAEDPACVRAQAHCGVAVALLEAAPISGAPLPFDEDPEPFAVDVGGACLAGDNLVVDVDGDGVEEAFPVGQFVDSAWLPAEEVSAVERGSGPCAPRFAMRQVVPPQNPKHWRGMDLIGVVDIDGDGRRELLFSYHYADRRTWAVYSARSTNGRMELVGEAEPWATR